MTEHVRNIWKGLGISVVAGIVVAALIWGVRETPDTVVCKSIRYTIEDIDERQYVTEGELNRLLEKEGQYPVDKAIRNISLQGIERAIRAHDLVRTTECYLTPRKEVRVRLTQRVPLLRVMTASDTYLIDEDRQVMPAMAVVKDSVLVVRGAVGVQIASGALGDFAEWLQTNKYWRERVRYVYVQSPQMVYLYLRGGLPRVVLGNMQGYERKLAKLRTFLDEGTEAMAGKKYTELDVRFRGQVVGR